MKVNCPYFGILLRSLTCLPYHTSFPFNNCRSEDFIKFFIQEKIPMDQQPFSDSILILTQVSKHCSDDPPIEILNLLLNAKCNNEVTEETHYRYI